MNCGMDPTREQLANQQLNAMRPAAKPEAPKQPSKQPTNPRCKRCKLPQIGAVSHATADDCLALVVSRMQMRSSLADSSKKRASAATEAAKLWKIKAKTANELLRVSQSRESRLLNQVVALDGALKKASERESALRQKLQEATARADEAEAQLKTKARALDMVVRRVDRLHMEVSA